MCQNKECMFILIKEEKFKVIVIKEMINVGSNFET